MSEYKHLAAAFIQYSSPSLAQNSIKAYRQDLSKLSNYCLARGIEEFSLSYSSIADFVMSLYPSAPATVRRTMYTIGRFCDFFIRKTNSKALNPIQHLNLPKNPKRLANEVWQLELIEVLDDLCESAITPIQIRDYALTEVLYSTGCRVTEVSDLNLNNLSIDNKECLVTGKGDKERFVYLTSKAQSALSHWLTARNQISRSIMNENAVFISRTGHRLSSNGIRRRIAKIGEEHLPHSRLKPHRLRHSFACHLLRSGVNLRYLQEMLGHKTIASTQAYLPSDYTMLKKVYDRCHPHAKKKLVDKNYFSFN